VNHHELYAAVRANTLIGFTRLDSLLTRMLSVNQQRIPGDVVECGVFRGGSSLWLASHMGPNRRLWCYDSFQGMPAATARDGPDAEPFAGQWVGTVEHLRELMASGGISPERYIIEPGWLKDTLARTPPQTIALLHIDVDWYESVTTALDGLYDRVASGGVVVLDDFGAWEGCREAFYDFCTRRGIKPLLERVGRTQAWWIKGKTHNRET
jgi:O-methyltransferase